MPIWNTESAVLECGDVLLLPTGASRDQDVSEVWHHGAHGNGRQHQHGSLHRPQVRHPQTERQLPRVRWQGVQQARSRRERSGKGGEGGCRGVKGGVGPAGTHTLSTCNDNSATSRNILRGKKGCKLWSVTNWQ